MISKIKTPLAAAIALALSGSAFAATGPSSSAAPYMVGVAPGVSFTSILTAGDAVGGYTMGGIPDGMGAYDNNDGTFTVLLAHEWGATAGTTHAHGAKGSYISKWTVNKSNLAVTAGSDLITSVQNYSGGAFSSAAANAFARFCSADLPKTSALYNAVSGKGYNGKIFMAGEETGAEGRAYGVEVSSGTAYQLAHMGRFSWENALANPYAQDKTVVIGTDDSTPGQVYLYVGDKQTTGNAVEKAGLVGGNLFGIKVNGFAADETRALGFGNGATFTAEALGDVSAKTGAQLQAASETLGVTEFLRPEDGAWSTIDPSKFYFVTTDRASATGTGTGAQTTQSAASRLYRLNFSDITNPSAGGTIDLLIDGAAGGVNGVRPEMMDNVAFDDVTGDLIISEDVGNNARSGRVWSYNPGSGQLVELAKHFAGNGDVGVAAAAGFSQDEEISGQIDVSALFAGVAGYDTSAYRYYLMVDQQHIATGDPLTVEKGQLMLMAKPVPVPAAVWLFGSAMAGFAGLRRKRA